MSSVAKKGEEVTLECLYTGPDTVTSMVLEVQSQGTWGAVQTNSFVAAVNQYVSILYSNCSDKFLTRESRSPTLFGFSLVYLFENAA